MFSILFSLIKIEYLVNAKLYQTGMPMVTVLGKGVVFS